MSTRFHPKTHKNWVLFDGVGRRPYFEVTDGQGGKLYFDGYAPYNKLIELNPEIHVVNKQTEDINSKIKYDTSDVDISAMLEEIDPGVYVTTDGTIVTKEDAPKGARFAYQPDIR